jgi:hypothetical protein
MAINRDVGFTSKAGILKRERYVRYGPKADITLAAARSENSSCRWAPLS